MAKAGRKSKYNREVADRVFQVIAQAGTDAAAIKAIHVHHDTFYKWIREKPEFSAGVVRAREAFHSREDPALIDQCREALIRHLSWHEETWQSAETTTLPDGSEVVKKSVRKVMRPPSEWAVKLVTPMLSGGLAGVQRAEISQDVTITDGNAREERFGKLFAQLDAYRTGVDDAHGAGDRSLSLDTGSADGEAT